MTLRAQLDRIASAVMGEFSENPDELPAMVIIVGDNDRIEISHNLESTPMVRTAVGDAFTFLSEKLAAEQAETS